MPASARCLAVPPVERISTPRAVRARASSVMPLLSETERMARSIRMTKHTAAALCCRAHVAACFLPDVVVEVHEVGDGVGVADGGHAEGGRPVVEVDGAADGAVAEVLLPKERRETRGASDHPVEVAA